MAFCNARERPILASDCRASNVEIASRVAAFEPTGQGWSRNGEWRCPSQADDRGGDAPCRNVDKGISETDQVYRVNLSWKANDTTLLYGTWSEGYRPGGINRNPFAGDYVSDFLTNYELGWKTSWLDDRLRFNGAVSARRYKKVVGPDKYQYMAVYEFASEAAFEAFQKSDHLKTLKAEYDAEFGTTSERDTFVYTQVWP